MAATIYTPEFDIPPTGDNDESDGGVKRHGRPDRYSTPDERQQHRVGGGIDRRYTVLPAARQDGRSAVFDPHQRTSVIVDPGVKGGGAVIDLSRIKKADVAGISRVSPDEPAAAFEMLATHAKQPDAQTYQEEADGGAADNGQPSALPPVGSDGVDPGVPVSHVQQHGPPPGYSPPREQTPPPAAPVNVVGGGGDQLADAMNRLSAALLGQTQPAARPSHPATPLRREGDHPGNRREPPQADENILGMRGIHSEPEPPNVNVILTTQDGGRSSVWYHDVIRTPKCVGLVYDTRFRGGIQHQPPVTMDKPMTLTLPGEAEPNEFVVHSFGIQFSFGCLDFVVLVFGEHEAAIDYEGGRHE